VPCDVSIETFSWCNEILNADYVVQIVEFSAEMVIGTLNAYKYLVLIE
jgi:hypothetical protein